LLDEFWAKVELILIGFKYLKPIKISSTLAQNSSSKFHFISFQIQ